MSEARGARLDTNSMDLEYESVAACKSRVYLEGKPSGKGMVSWLIAFKSLVKYLSRMLLVC